MYLRQVELNNKLKAIQLIEASNTDDSHKRDNLSKVNFKKEPKEVYEDTKSAIKDILGDSESQNNPTAEAHSSVLFTKPWKSRNRSRSREYRQESQDRRRSYS